MNGREGEKVGSTENGAKGRGFKGMAMLSCLSKPHAWGRPGTFPRSNKGRSEKCPEDSAPVEVPQNG